MNNKKNKLFNLISSHKILSAIIFTLIIAIICVIVLLIITDDGDIENSDKVSNSEIKDLIDNKESGVIYLYNSNKDKCSFCSTATSYLNKKDISYLAYDLKDIDSDTYDELLKLVNIDKDLFGYPALVYVREGEMFANLINIDSTDVMDTFIDGYDLNLL